MNKNLNDNLLNYLHFAFLKSFLAFLDRRDFVHWHNVLLHVQLSIKIKHYY